MNPLQRLAIRLSFHPSLAFNSLMCALGIWRRWDWVDGDVLLGVIPARRDIPRLRGMGICAIVNMCAEFDGHARELAECGITQLQLPTIDYQFPTAEHLLAGIHFIRERIDAREKVYIHCKAGRGRGATMALCLIMATRTIPATEAFAVVRVARPHLTMRLDRRPPVLAVERSLEITNQRLSRSVRVHV